MLWNMNAGMLEDEGPASPTAPNHAGELSVDYIVLIKSPPIPYPSSSITCE